jgi:hypothetical protein
MDFMDLMDQFFLGLGEVLTGKLADVYLQIDWRFRF